jgi:integrase
LARITCYVDAKRRTIRLGKVSETIAEKWQARIGEVIASMTSGAGLAPDTVAWIESLEDEGYGKLVAAGLMMPRVVEETPVRTLQALCDTFKARQSVKPSTAASYGQTIDSLKAFLGADRDVATITTEDADEWKVAIAKATKGEGERKKSRVSPDNRLSGATVAKRVMVAKRIFGKAKQWKWIAENPFGHLRAGSQANPDRNVYVPADTINAILDACPNVGWRCLIALARFAGLRCPSEIGLLTWDDVDRHAGKLRVRSPKTEGHGESHAVRFVPIAPQLMAILADAWDAAPSGVKLVVPMAARQTANLRTQFERIITRANVEAWPRLFQNLRASCETDWAQTYPAHVCAKWLGHSPRIASTHYLMVRDHHFQDVIEGGSVRGTKCGTTRHQNRTETAMSNPATARNLEEQNETTPEETVIPSGVAQNWTGVQVGSTGTELTTVSAGKRGVAVAVGTKRGTDLADLAEALARLTDEQRAAIAAMIRGMGG